MGPKNESKLGEQFYGSGYFQKLLESIQQDKSHPYKVVQKNDTVTLAIQNVEDEDAAIEFLTGLPEFEMNEEQVEV